MLPYLLTFITSILLISIGLKFKSRIVKYIFVFIGLMLPCILAGYRDISIGTDTRGYIYNLYNLASQTNSLTDFFNLAYKWYSQKDYLYLIISYIFGKNSFGFNNMLFVYETLIVFPLYLSFKKLKFNGKSIIIGLSFFYFLMYNVTLNMLRQSIAISFCVLSFSYFLDSISKADKRDRLLSYLFLLIGYRFHSTTIVIVIIMMLYIFYNSKSIKEKDKELLSVIVVIFSCIIVLFYKKICLFLGSSGIYPLAMYYLNHYSIKDFSFYQIFINLLIICIVLLNKKEIQENNYSYNFLYTSSIANLLISSGLGYYIL